LTDPPEFHIRTVLLPQGIFRMIRDGDLADHGRFKNPPGEHLKDMAFEKSVGLDRMKISVFQNNLHTRHSGYLIRQKNKSYTIHHFM
jgi:hypothetical protein